MGMGWDLHVVPRSAAFAPDAVSIRSLLAFLAESFDANGGWQVGDGEETDVETAAELFATSAANDPSAAVRVYQDVMELFGWDGDAEDPDQNFWSCELRVEISAAARPRFDLEMGDDARCPSCETSLVDAILDRDDGDFREPLRCACGKAVASADLKFKGRGRATRFAVVFAGNKGWHADVRDPREAFKDAAFLPALEKLLGTPVDVLARST